MKSVSSSSLRLRSALFAAAVLVLGANSGSLMAVPPAGAPLTRQSLQALYNQHKINAEQLKLLNADVENVATAQRNLDAFEAKFKPDQRKLPADQQREKTLQQQLAAAQQKYAADQMTLAPRSGTVGAGTTRADDESPKEYRAK